LSFPNHTSLLVNPNKMFGLGSFWLWIANKSRCVKKTVIHLDYNTFESLFLW